jgi:hypothetical protein
MSGSRGEAAVTEHRLPRIEELEGARGELAPSAQGIARLRWERRTRIPTLPSSPERFAGQGRVRLQEETRRTRIPREESHRHLFAPLSHWLPLLLALCCARLFSRIVGSILAAH